MKTMYPELELDLTFHPVENTNLRYFTRAQIEQYNEDGYVTGVTLFEGERLKEMRAFFERSKKRLTTYEQFKSFHQEIPELYDIVAHSVTVGYLQDLLGPNVICHASQYIRKEPDPGSTRDTIYHQDATFNPMDARCAIVWLAVDEVFVENGCMGFVPGSHKLGVVDCSEKNHAVPNPERYGATVPIELQPGQAVIFSDLLIHSSPPNRTADRVRGGFTATYAGAELVPTLGKKKWAVVCSGEDAENHWQVNARPV
ncbi:MAG: phytanoyl-CoA dioxygenase family protein [bacterium]|nr:phytanoyl-CoA dioxygenase family protein [bacterium]